MVYAWDLGTWLYGSADVYLATVRSMSESWHSFLFGAFDPAASITLDKIPAGLWPAALSARIFGFHAWATLLPQVLAAVLTILVLYRTTRRLAGPTAGLVAAGAMAAMPVAAALTHVTWPDTYLTLLLVLAADATLRATETGRLRTLVLAGVWVGLAFHTKMLVAWGALPALAITYLVAAPVTSVWRRVGHVGLAGMSTLAASSVWMLVAWLTPAENRPYIDGTDDNSPMTMVFGYNGFSIFSAGEGSRTETPFETGVLSTLFGSMAPQVMWLIPMALLALVCGLGRRVPRTDLPRAGLLLWAGWLVVYGAVFSTAYINHIAYCVVLAPAVAALFGIGVVTCWRAYREHGHGWRTWLLPASVAATVGWSVVLSLRFPDFMSWSVPVTAVLGGLAVAALVLAKVSDRLPPATKVAGAATGLVAMLLVPGAWTAATTNKAAYSGIAANPEAGPMGAEMHYVELPPEQKQLVLDGLDQQAALVATAMETSGGEPLTPEEEALRRFTQSNGVDRKYQFATPNSGLASAFIITNGTSVLPVGGFVGDAPFPTRDDFVRMVDDHALRFVVLAMQPPPGAAAPGGPAPGSAVEQIQGWVEQNCATVPPDEYFAAPESTPVGTRWTLYDCAR